MSARRAAGCAGLLAVVLVSAGSSAAQAAPVALEPNAAGQGTTVVLSADPSVLSPGGQPGRSISLTFGRGMAVDATSREQLCKRSEAASGGCPDASRIGFGRYAMKLRGYEAGGSESELAWAIDAYLGEPQRRGDVASVVLISKLLGADLVGALLAPSIGTTVPATATSSGRLVRRSGRYSFDLRFDELPAQVGVAAPVTATPASLDLSLGAARQLRQNFVRRFKIRTPSGFEIRKVRDHRLVGHYLFRTPSSCNGSWPAELAVEIGGRVKRTSAPIACTKAATAALSGAGSA
jgi:hypothetical protein